MFSPDHLLKIYMRYISSIYLLYLYILVILSHSLFSSTLLFAQHCDTALITDTYDPFKYEERGDQHTGTDRCEGFYLEEVNAISSIQLASLTLDFEEFDAAEHPHLLIQWTSNTDAPIDIRAMGLHRTLLYQMDTRRSPPDSLFIWPTDMLFTYDMNRLDLGIYGKSSFKLKAKQEPLFIPLRITKDYRKKLASGVRFLFVSDREWEHVFLSLSRVEEGSGKKEKVFSGRRLENYPYSAFIPVEASIPADVLQRGNVYALEVGALLTNGGLSSREIYFYYP